MRKIPFDRVQAVHPYAWLWEPLEVETSFVLRAMFGTKAAYLDGKLTLCFSDQGEPWHGLLVCTDREYHASLMAGFPALSPHPVLGKWLYLRDTAEAFDSLAPRLVRLVQRRDPRVGVVPKPRKGRHAKPLRQRR